MRILNLANGEFQVWHTHGEHFDVVFRRTNGHYCQYNAVGEEQLDMYIKAWTRIKYILNK